jgi:hypothetical protein
MNSNINKISQFLRPDRYLLVIFVFFILFPVFIDLIAPDTSHGYAYGKVDSGGNEIYTVEGGNALQYEWYYPVIYPFMLVWYISVVIYMVVFNLIEYIIPLKISDCYGIGLIVYYYVLSALLAVSLKKLDAVIKKGWEAK